MSSNFRKPLFFAIAVPAVVVAFWSTIFFRSSSGKEVAVVEVALAPAERVLAVNGRIRPRLSAEIRSPYSGDLVELPFDVGARVEAGQIIARVDDEPESAEIEQAKAAVAAQEATLSQARRDLARYEALGEFAAAQVVEQRRVKVEEGERELARRIAEVDKAIKSRDRRVLRAPFSGVILERPVDPGQSVRPETVIYRIADLSSPEISAEVDEIYAAEIHAGMEALIRLPGREKVLGAEVLHVEPRVDPATGARDVRLGSRESITDAPAGLTVTINLIIERRANAITVPRRAIVGTPSKAHVLIVGADEKVVERGIGFVDWPAESVIVTEGVAIGDRVLVNPTATRPGEKVQVLK